MPTKKKTSSSKAPAKKTGSSSASKSKKTTLDTLGLVLSIFAFIVGAICLVLNIVGITIW